MSATASLAEAILHLYPEADLERRVIVGDRGDGVKIERWDSTLGPEPSAQQIAAAKLQVQAKKTAAARFQSARLSMADLFHSLAVDIRAEYLAQYSAIEKAFDRGDAEAGVRAIQTMTLKPEHEDIRAQFLALIAGG